MEHKVGCARENTRMLSAKPNAEKSTGHGKLTTKKLSAQMKEPRGGRLGDKKTGRGC